MKRQNRIQHAYRVLVFLGVLSAVTKPANAQFLENPTVHYSISVPSGGSFGWAVADLRDINGDGKKDFAVAALNTSRVYLYSGATGTAIRTLLVPFLPAAAQLGYSLADAGDTNNDGVTDIVVGAAAANANRGTVYVFSGANGAVLLTISGENPGDHFGSAVGAAGDVNEDGRADVLIGADLNDAVGLSSGRAYVYSGANGAQLRIYEAEATGHNFGGGTANAGDIDEDGFTDHIIGAPNAGPFNEGRAYVYSGQTGALLHTLLSVGPGGQFGQFFVATAGDVNGDGTTDLYVGDYAESNGRGRAYAFSGVDGSIIHSLQGPLVGDGQGCGRYAGDVNGDNRDDLIVGRYTNSTGANGAGQVAIYSGFDGSVLETFTATTVGANVGFDAVGLGDIDGDERLDFLLAGATGDVVHVVSSSKSATPVPTVSQWGVVVLALSVLIAGTMLQRNQIAVPTC